MLELWPPWSVMTSATWEERHLTTHPSVPFDCLGINMSFSRGAVDTEQR